MKQNRPVIGFVGQKDKVSGIGKTQDAHYSAT